MQGTNEYTPPEVHISNAGIAIQSQVSLLNSLQAYLSLQGVSEPTVQAAISNGYIQYLISENEKRKAVRNPSTDLYLPSYFTLEFFLRHAIAIHMASYDMRFEKIPAKHGQITILGDQPQSVIEDQQIDMQVQALELHRAVIAADITTKLEKKTLSDLAYLYTASEQTIESEYKILTFI